MPYDVSQLLTFAQGIVGDWVQKNNIATFLAPEVPVVTEKFFYKNYGSGNAFLAIDTRRSLGGGAARIAYTVTDSQGVLQENSLECTIDDIERRQNPESEGTLEMIKTRDLTLTILNNYLKVLFQFMKASTAVTTTLPNFVGTLGQWVTNAASDPVAEVDAIVKNTDDTTGVVPNRIYMDLTSWLMFKNNKAVLDRIRFTRLGNATLDTVVQLFAVPLEIRIGGGALYTDVGGSANNVFVFYGQDSPGIQDPSFMKVFVRASNRFTAMRQYREEKIRSDVYYLDWQQLIAVTGAGIVTRIQTT
jgi:hypothetical protein